MKADNPFANVKLMAPPSSDSSKINATSNSEGFAAFTNINPFLSSSGTGFLSTALNDTNSQPNTTATAIAAVTTGSSKRSAAFAEFKDPFKAMREAAGAGTSSSSGFLSATTTGTSSTINGKNLSLGLNNSSSLGLGCKNSGSKEDDVNDEDNVGDANYDPEAEVVVTVPEGRFDLLFFFS